MHSQRLWQRLVDEYMEAHHMPHGNKMDREDKLLLTYTLIFAGIILVTAILVALSFG